MLPDSNTALVGTLLDQRYQIVQALSQGGFGHTYLARDTRRPGNPTCVVKHLKPATSDPEFLSTARRLFNSEAETLETLGTHDQIPRLLAYFEEHEEFFLVEEYIAGHPLSVELKPGQRWSDRQVIELLQEVLPILEFIHDRGVIHRDIKPDNIIRRTSDNKLVLVDFGAVKQVKMQSIALQEPLDRDTVAIGTPGYMPSEQSQGRPRPSSDLYALGTIAIQALTGMSPTQLPEDAETGEILWRDGAQTNELLAAVLTQMVRHYFMYRYQSATEVLQALEPLMQPYTPKALAIAIAQMGRYYSNKAYQFVSKAWRSSIASQTHRSASVSESNIPHSAPTLPLAVSTQKTVTIAPTSPDASQTRASGDAIAISVSQKHLPWVLGVGTAALVIAIATISTLRNSPSELPTQTTDSAILDTPTPEPSNTPKPEFCIVVVSPSNVRSKPGGSKTGKVVPAGQATATGKEDGGWIELSAPESGWVWQNRTKKCP